MGESGVVVFMLWLQGHQTVHYAALELNDGHDLHVRCYIHNQHLKPQQHRA